MIEKDKIIRLISTLLIISFIVPTILFSKPKEADAQWFTYSITDFFTGTSAPADVSSAGSNIAQLAQTVKTAAIEVLKQAAMAVARKALQEVTKSTVNWINSGFHGSPLFLENPQSFFQDIAKSEVKTLVNQFGYDSVRYPFGKDFSLNIINSYKRQLADNASYSLSTVINDPALLYNYQNNFNVGGWNGFLINTQYPQNNYLGFNMIANEELARQIAGTNQAPAEKVRTLLQQGLGFLSPQICQTNKNYNTGYNEWNAPSFDQAAFDKDHEGDDLNTYAIELLAAKKAFNDPNGENVCPPKADGSPGLINTTPGSVVANQINTSLTSVVRNKELAAAMGNSLSAIFDALLNKFIGDGLNSLASRVNPPPTTEDNWSYDGQTLGTVVPYDSQGAWDSGPETPIKLDEFKKAVQTAIDNTTKELQTMDGITQLLAQIWPEARKLDICIPGPDLGWQDRLQSEILRNSQKLQKIQGDDNAKKSEEASSVLKELKFAADFFKDWINNKMITELPSSILFMEAVDDVKVLSQQSDELTDARRIKNQALARVRAVQTALNTITTQPAPGSAQEKTLISLKKQYDGARLGISTTLTLSDRQNELDVAKDKFESLKKMTDPLNPQGCPAERKAKSWGLPGGWQSSFSGPGPVVTPAAASELKGVPPNSEQAIFCSLPIIGGYNHESFKNETGISHPEIPMVNAKRVLRYEVTTIKSFLTSLPGNHTTAAYVNIQMSCSTIFNAKLLDYKGNLPSLTTTTETFVPLPNDGDNAPTGTCTYETNSDGITPTPDTDITKEECALNNGNWEPSAPLGTCTVDEAVINDTTESDCSAANGTWEPNNP